MIKVITYRCLNLPSIEGLKNGLTKSRKKSLTYRLNDMLRHFGYTHELLNVGSVVLGGPYHRLLVEVGDDVLVLPCTQAKVVGTADDVPHAPILFEGEGACLTYGIHAAQVIVDAEGTLTVEHDIYVGAIGQRSLTPLGKHPCTIEVIGVNQQGGFGGLFGLGA